MDKKEKFLGSLVGSALGDAIGELAFHFSGKDHLMHKLEIMKSLIYTDDTAMAIGTAQSIIKEVGLNPQDLGDTFKQNFHKEPWRGYAPGPPTIFSIVDRTGASYIDAAESLYGGKGSFGNGAAMRAAPVGLYYHDSDDLYAQARLSASVTHSHPIGIDGAAVQSRAVALALDLDPQDEFPEDDFIENLIAFAETQEMKTKLHLLQRLLKDHSSPMHAAQQIGRSVTAHQSLPFALFCFLRHTESFQECLFCAILNGGDRDTLGAMSGAVSGAYLGSESVPSKWKDKLENRALIEHLALNLLEKK